MRRALGVFLAAVTLLAFGRGLAVVVFDHFPIVVTVVSAFVVGVVWNHELTGERTLR